MLKFFYREPENKPLVLSGNADFFSLCTLALAELLTPDVFVCPQIQAVPPGFHKTLHTGIAIKSFKRSGVYFKN